MSAKVRVNLEARKNRLQRRFVGALGESLTGAVVLMASTVLCALFIYSCTALLSASYFQIREISVRGVKELTEKDILALAKVPPRTNILAVNTDALQRRISANPWVKAVYVGRELPDRLVLDVRERTPVALVKQGENFYLVDKNGFAFKKLVQADEVDLAIVTGVHIEAKETSALLPEALKLLDQLGTEQYASLGTVSEVHVDEVFGLSILTDKGLHLKLGRDNFENKIRQLDLVLADLEKRGMKKGHLFVDLTDIAKVTVQHRDVMGKAREEKKGPQYRI